MVRLFRDLSSLHHVALPSRVPYFCWQGQQGHRNGHVLQLTGRQECTEDCMPGSLSLEGSLQLSSCSTGQKMSLHYQIKLRSVLVTVNSSLILEEGEREFRCTKAALVLHGICSRRLLPCVVLIGSVDRIRTRLSNEYFPDH